MNFISLLSTKEHLAAVSGLVEKLFVPTCSTSLKNFAIRVPCKLGWVAINLYLALHRLLSNNALRLSMWRTYVACALIANMAAQRRRRTQVVAKNLRQFSSSTAVESKGWPPPSSTHTKKIHVGNNYKNGVHCTIFDTGSREDAARMTPRYTFQARKLSAATICRHFRHANKGRAPIPAQNHAKLRHQPFKFSYAALNGTANHQRHANHYRDHTRSRLSPPCAAPASHPSSTGPAEPGGAPTACSTWWWWWWWGGGGWEW